MKPEIDEAVSEIFQKQAFVMGPAVASFEKEVADYIGVKNAISCSSGTDALVLALKGLGIGPGDEVITTPYSFFASASSILLAGATPVFVDIDPDTYNLNPSLLEDAFSEKTKAVLVVHLFGQCADMSPVLSFGQEHNIHVIEDFAQSVGATYQGRGAGSMGTVGATSFYPTKNLGGAGEGGAVTTNSSALAEHLKYLRVHGMKERYYHDNLGWNSRMGGVQAAVLNVKLKHLDKMVLRRRQLANRYISALSSLEKDGRLFLPSTSEGNEHVWNQFVVRVENRDEVRGQLMERGIPTDIFYPKTISAQKVFLDRGYDDQNTPIASFCADRALALPIFPELRDEEQQMVISALEQVLSKKLSVEPTKLI